MAYLGTCHLAWQSWGICKWHAYIPISSLVYIEYFFLWDVELRAVCLWLLCSAIDSPDAVPLRVFSPNRKNVVITPLCVHGIRIIIRYIEIMSNMPQDLVSLKAARFGFRLSKRSDIWQAPREQRCRDACQISERYDYQKSNGAASSLHESWW